MFNFKKPRNELEGLLSKLPRKTPSIPDEMYTICPECKGSLITTDLPDIQNLCSFCGHHFKIKARHRLNFICDDGTFVEFYKELISKNVLNFPDYDKKLKNAKLESGENDGVITGICEIMGNKTAIFAMDSTFMMGSMGCVVGEKITRIFEYAAQNNLPVVGFTLSGGARMQEGILSLMQMAKTSGAVKRHSDGGGLYICVLTNPTTGGVTASFAMEGDIIVAEPKALICFAGPRVIEQTTKQKLPNGFQRSEFLLERGFVDAIVSRNEQKEYLGKLLDFHKRGAK